MNIAVTGATGFVGKHLTLTLRANTFPFVALDRKRHNLFDSSSLRDLVSNKDYIVHLAGVNKDGATDDIIRTNILGTKGLAEAIATYAPNAILIFASSFQIYRPNDIYGSTKKIAEEIIDDYTARGAFRATILRFSNIYGPGAKPFHNSVISTFVHLIKKRESLHITGDGSQKRDYLHVDDAVSAIILSLYVQPRTCEYIPICTGRLTSLNEIIKHATNIVSRDIRVQYDTIHQAEDEQKLIQWTKAKKLLNWSPTISIADGLRSLLSME